ncbi:unnamed protein product [Closterium sp. NIES-64]|nr:unnamed protein product [Closterium sp. NIES-64]
MKASVDVEKVREQLLREGFVILKDALPRSTEWSEPPKLPAQLFPTTAASESESESDAELISTPASLVAKALLPSLPASALRVVEDVTGTNVDQGPATWHTVACTPPADVELSRQRLDDAILTVVVATQNTSGEFLPERHVDSYAAVAAAPYRMWASAPAPTNQESDADVAAPRTFSLPPELSEQELEALEEEEEKANLGNWAVAIDARSLMLWRLTSQARHLLEAQRFEEALPLLRRAVGLRPQDAWLWYQAAGAASRRLPRDSWRGGAGRKCMLEDSERFLLRAIEAGRSGEQASPKGQLAGWAGKFLSGFWCAPLSLTRPLVPCIYMAVLSHMLCSNLIPPTAFAKAAPILPRSCSFLFFPVLIPSECLFLSVGPSASSSRPLPYASLINALIAMGRGREEEATSSLHQLLAIPRLAAIRAANPATAATVNHAVTSE